MRYSHIDIAKGFGIIFVVLFHFTNLNEIKYFYEWGGYVTTVYMSLFFILSGLFYNPNNLLRRLKRLAIPYICFLVIGFSVNALKEIVKNESVDFSCFYRPLLGYWSEYANTPIWSCLH